jgi:hypothetical protein
MKAFYTAIKLHIQTKLPQVLHIDLWNDQLMNLESENQFLRPAIFVELDPVQWATNKNSKKGTVNFILHLVTDCYDNRADDTYAIEALDKVDETEEQFDGHKMENCTPFENTSTTIDNNHGNLIENLLGYSCEYTKCITRGKKFVEVEPNLKVEGEFK